MAEKQLEGLLNSTLTGLRGMGDVKNVVGDPIVAADGTTVIPYSRVSFGYGGGGAGDDDEGSRVIGGSGGGVTLTPMGFLIISPNGETKMINVDSQNPTEQLIESFPDIIDSIASLFKR